MSIPKSALDFLKTCGIPNLADNQLEQLEAFRIFLETVNAVTNLTRVETVEDFWVKHIADSLSIGRFFPEIFTRPLRIADVGCGGGFPLLPLAWACPDSTLVGIDTKHKKIDFVNACCEKFGWQNCRGIALQAREAGRQRDLHHSFDIVVSRAMSDAARMLKECRSLLKPDTGRMILYKTPALIETETPAARREAAKFGFTFSVKPVFALPLNAGDRQFAVFTPQTLT